MSIHPWLAAAIGVLALLVASPAWAGDEAERELAETKVALGVAAELRKFSDTARQSGYVTLARRSLARTAVLGVSGTRITELERELATLDDAPKLNTKTRASLEKRFTKLRGAQAAKLAAQAVNLVNEDPKSQAARNLATAAISLDPNAEKARTILGQTHVKDWGWVSQEDADRLADGEVPIGDGWRPKKGLGKDPRPWGEHWVVTSDHFRIHSNLPLKRVFAARDRVEQLRERFLADWEGTLPLVDDERVHDVYVFAKKSEYEQFILTDPNHIKGVPGQYSPQLHRSTFFDVETLRKEGGQVSSLEELMLHECTHQLFNELAKIDAQAIDPMDSKNAWINEGIAEFYGMHTVGKTGLVLDRKAVRGMLRTIQVKKNPDLVKTATELAGMTRGEFQSPDGNQRVTNYATAGFLCLMLSEGATRGPWQRFVRAFFCDGNAADAFEKAMGDHTKDLDERFRKFLGKL